MRFVEGRQDSLDAVPLHRLGGAASDLVPWLSRNPGHSGRELVGRAIRRGDRSRLLMLDHDWNVTDGR